jgi:autotransporter-associated beta strand protein
VLSNAAALGAAASLLTVQNDATARLVLDGGFDLAKPLTLACKQSAAGNAPVVVNASGSNTLSGQVTLTTGGSFWTFEVDAGKLTVRGNLTNVATSNTRTVRLRGAGVGEIQGAIANSTNNLSLTAVTKEEDGTWVLSGNSVYTGPTTVSAGTLVVNGTLAAGSAVANNAGTLGGFGTINGPVTVTSTGTLAPGDAGIGTLTVNNSLSLEGTTVMEVSHSAADKVKGVGTLTFGGTLQIVVVGSLTGGEVFKLFDATTYSGDFATYDLPALPSPLAWDATMVPVNGTLRVMGGAPPQPTIPPVSVSGGNLLVPVTTYAGYSYVLQSATNLTPTIYWSNESTNAGTGGTLTFTVPLEPGKPRKFLRIWVY